MLSVTRSKNAYRLIIMFAFIMFALLVEMTIDAARPSPVLAEGAEVATCGSSNVRFLGQSEVLDKTSLDGVQVRELSGITYDRHGTYYANADRVGAAEVSRFFRLNVPVSADGVGLPSVEAMTSLQRADGSPSTGTDFDGEGIALTHSNALFIASEGRAGFQTEIRRYDLDGSHIATLPAPTRFLVPPAVGGEGTNNLSFESMALSPNQRSLFTSNETPLTGDGATGAREGRIRILRYEDRGAGSFVAESEYYYLMDAARNPTGPLEVGVAEILALSEDRLLVLERGFVAGLGNTIRIYEVSLEDAQDVSDDASLAAPGLQPVGKTLVVDLVTCPDGGATLPPGAVQPNPLLDNFEAMVLGPILPDGRQALILLSDDNSGSNQRTRLVALSIHRHDISED